MAPLRGQPMDLDFTDEQDMLRKAVRSLCEDAAETVRQLENDPRGYDDGFWQKLVSMGLPTGNPATSRPPEITSSIANSSATRMGGL